MSSQESLAYEGVEVNKYYAIYTQQYEENMLLSGDNIVPFTFICTPVFHDSFYPTHAVRKINGLRIPHTQRLHLAILKVCRIEWADDY